MAATDARPIPRRNIAYRVTFAMYDADRDLVEGAANLAGQVSKDAAPLMDCTNPVGAIGGGLYYLDLTAAEMNADTVAVIVSNPPASVKDTALIFYPEESGDLRADAVQLVGSAQSALDLKNFADLGYDPAARKVQGVVLTDQAASVTALAAGSIDAGTLTPAAVLALQTGLATSTEVVGGCAGAGDVLVDHDYGGVGALAYLDDRGVGIDNGVVLAYLQSEYDAGLRSQEFIRGRTTTNAVGRWTTPLMLDPAPYYLVFYVQGRFRPSIVPLVVA